jgi:hypothetical protein
VRAPETSEALARHLVDIEREMGLRPDLQRARRVAELLIRLR